VVESESAHRRLEERGLVGCAQAVVVADGRLEHAGARLGVKPSISMSKARIPSRMLLMSAPF